MSKTYDEINEKIRKGEAVVVTAEEMAGIVDEEGAEQAAEHVDVVTTGTFSPMCSSGAIINTGHTTPRMRISKAWLNDVPAYSGLAAVDLYIGATELPENDPKNREHPGNFPYGGAHVIQDLIAGEDVRLTAESYGTDCYPRKKLDTWLNIETLNQASLLNPRNGYQNYGVAVNLAKDRDIYTYMGVVKADLGSANYCSAGQLSPLLNDPYYRTIGIGTRIYLGGGVGYVYYHGTQHNPGVPRSDNGVPKGGAGTIAVTGDMKNMRPDRIVGVSMYGYGVSLAIGLGIPIPILNADMARYTGVSDAEIVAPITDYSNDYPSNEASALDHVSYAELKSGEIEFRGRKIPTTPLSSYVRAREIRAPKGQQIVKRDAEPLLSVPTEVLLDEGRGETVKTGGHRRVGGKE
ncbi:MAG: homocysteine biosynthesis protein, partial [Armatimonadota bacterium]